MTPKQSRETAQALLQVLGDKAPKELRDALAEQPPSMTSPKQSKRSGGMTYRRPRHNRRIIRPRFPRVPESTAPLTWLAVLVVTGACLLSIMGSCDAQRSTRAATQTWGHK